MDTLSEIRRKMDSGNNISIAIATDNLINSIKTKFKGTHTDMTHIPEMLLLQEYCCHKNPVICTNSIQALCKFMTTNNYQNQLLIDWLVVLSTQIKCKTGFIQEIFELIVFWLKSNESINYEYINTLIDLLIKIMEENLDEWNVILFHMKINTHFDNYEFIKKWLNVTKRLFKYIFLSQTPYNYRISFVKLFVEILCYASDYNLLFDIFSWIQTDHLDDILFAHYFVEEFSDKIPDTYHETKYNLCLCLLQTSIQLISHYSYDPTHLLQCLNKFLIICPCTSNIILLSISSTLSSSSSKFVLKIIDFCLAVIQNYGCHKIIAQTVISIILQWNRTKVIDDEKINLFLSTINSNNPTSKSCIQNHNLLPYLASNSFLITSYSLVQLCSELNDKKAFSKWLSKINQNGILLNDTLLNFYLAGIYLCNIGDRSQQKIILKLLNKKILLPLISYTLDLETYYYNRFDLIKTIPIAACNQENMPLIISFIKRFESSNEETLNLQSIDLYYDLWMYETRCYRFLFNCLSNDKPGWQWNVVKSYTIKKMVKLNPNSDLVTLLKQMLRIYLKRSMYLPMKLTLESLVDLCNSEYIIPDTILKIIDENIFNIHHPSIIPSYCNLIAISANQSIENEKRNEFIKKLWCMVLNSNDTTVKCALKSLALINVENIPLHVLPEKFQSFSKVVTQLGNVEKIDLFNGPIPGECWIKFLQNINKTYTNEAQYMLTIWLKQELEKNVLPRVQSDHEPKNLKHLSNHSIARGLMSFIVPKRKKMLDVDEDIKVACLTIINNTDRPMYPFDWYFLEKYVTEGPQSKLWKESIILIAKQSLRSTSAFRLLYKCFEHSSNFNNNEVKLFFTTLFKVSNIIYHDLQKKFVIDIVNRVMNNMTNEKYSDVDTDVDLLCHILSECKQILQSPETHMENVNFICNILENIWFTIHLENKKILSGFIECFLTMPKEVSTNLRPYPVQESMLLKFIILSCAQNFVFSNVSFINFNECIQACIQFSKEDNFLYDTINEIFKFKMFVPYHQEFITNFMIYLSSYTKNKNSFTNDLFNALCTIFINLILILSNYDSISSANEKKLNYLVFPLALVIFSKNSSQSYRVIEWLKTMRAIQYLPEEYSKLFYCCLTAFKNDKCLLEWTNKKKIILQ